MLGLVLLIAVPVQRARLADAVYGLAVIWALVGIIVANRSEPGQLPGLRPLHRGDGGSAAGAPPSLTARPAWPHSGLIERAAAEAADNPLAT